MRRCTYKNCKGNHLAKGLCKLHYDRKRRGTPLDQPKLVRIERGKYSHCTYKNCKKKHLAKGLCEFHYRRKITRVPLDAPLRKTRSHNMTYTQFIEWCLGKAKIINGCLKWQTVTHKSGYPSARFGSKHLRVGRAVLQYFKGKPKEGQVMMHLCDERSCILPSHLKWGTNKENTQDMMNKGRHNNQYTKHGRIFKRRSP